MLLVRLTVGTCEGSLNTDHESFNLAAGVVCDNLRSTNTIGQLDWVTCRVALLISEFDLCSISDYFILRANPELDAIYAVVR